MFDLHLITNRFVVIVKIKEHRIGEGQVKITVTKKRNQF